MLNNLMVPCWLTCIEAGRSNCDVIESNISIGALSPHSCHLHMEPAENILLLMVFMCQATGHQKTADS